MGSRLVGSLITLVIIGCLVGYRFMQKDDEAEQIRVQVMGYIEQLPDFDTHALLYTTWFDAHHETLFEQHYRMGGRRVASSFNGDAYIDDLFTAMAIDATAEGYTDQAALLRELGESLYLEPE